MAPPGRPASARSAPPSYDDSPVGNAPTFLAPVVIPSQPPPPRPRADRPVFAGAPEIPLVPAVAPRSNRQPHWNWAGGCVIGLSVLILVFAAPRFAVAVDLHQLGDQQTGDWLLYGAALGSLLTMLCLASRRVAVVALLSLVTAAVAVVAVVKLQGSWSMSDHSAWASLGLVIGLGLLGLGATLGLRRVG